MRSYSSAAPQGQQDAADVNPLEGVGFKLDGETFMCQGRVSLLDTSEMAAAADAALDSRDPAGMAIIANFLRTAFGPQEYRRLKAHVRVHGTKDEALLDIIGGIVEDVEANVARVAGRPTQLPSGSSPGPQAQDGRTSRIIGLQQGDVQVMRLAAAGGETVDPALAQERDDQAAAKLAAQARPGQRKGRQPAQSRAAKLG